MPDSFISKIKDLLKHVFPPPTKSFMREIDMLNSRLSEIDRAIANKAGSIHNDIALLRQEQAKIKKSVDDLRGDLQRLERIQKDCVAKIDREAADNKKKLQQLDKRCSTLSYRESRLLQDKRFIEQSVFGQVPNYIEVGLELTNYCGYNCVFCPREQMTRPKGVMSEEDIRLVASRLGVQASKKMVVWTDGMGEVLLLDDFFDKIRQIRQCMPNCMPIVVSTLGYEKDDAFWDEFLRVGIKRIQVSIYGYDDETYKLLHGADRLQLVRKNLDTLIEKNEALGGPIEIVVGVEDFGQEFFEQRGLDYARQTELRERFEGGLKDHPSVRVIRRTLHNRGQAFHFAAPNEGVKKCFIDPYPMRENKLYVTWDLNVIPCPMVFNNEIVLGNLREQSLEEIYTSKTYLDFIRHLRTNQLQDYPSCRNCNE